MEAAIEARLALAPTVSVPVRFKFDPRHPFTVSLDFTVPAPMDYPYTQSEDEDEMPVMVVKWIVGREIFENALADKPLQDNGEANDFIASSFGSAIRAVLHPWDEDTTCSIDFPRTFVEGFIEQINREITIEQASQKCKQACDNFLRELLEEN